MKPNIIKTVILAVLLLTLILSCRDRREDHSRSVEEYKALGMPDPGKKWDMEDYTQANNVLAKLKWEHPFELPVKDSKKSGLLFDHMVSMKYLSFLKDSTMSLNEKAERISEFTRVDDYWKDIYTIPILKQNPYQRELLELRIFNLKLMEEMVNLMHQINQSDDPADAALKYGYDFIIGNYLTSLHTSLRAQHSTSQFPEPDLERMADSIYASVMRNKEWMDGVALSELNQSLHSVIDSTSSDYIQDKYRNLSEVLTGKQTTVSR